MKTHFFFRSPNKPKLFICTVLALIMLATNITPAFALRYWRTGRENKSSGTSIRWTGGHGYNYVMNSPTITWGHVNSMYIQRPNTGNGYYYEIGWVWWAASADPWGVSTPRWFYAKLINGAYYGPYYGIGNPTQGTNYLISAQIESNGKVQLKVDSTIKVEETSNFYPDGQIIWGSERQNTNESNYAHFWHLMKRRHDYSWALWEIHDEYFPPNTTPDPGYHWSSPSEPEGYSLAN